MGTLREVVIPDGTDRIGSYWFWGSEVESVTIPSSVKKIGAEAFYSCRQLKKLVLRKATRRAVASAIGALTPQSDGSALRLICTRAFYGCESLAAVDFPDGLEEMGVDAFCESGLESVTTPLSTRIIHQGAFCRCQNL